MQLPSHKALRRLINYAISSYPKTGRIIRIEVDCEPMPPATWLLQQHQCPRYYWANRERSFEMAGIGESDVVQPKSQEEIDVALASIHSKITNQNASVKYYGGYRFYKSPKGNDRWQHFKPYRFVLPLLELCQTEERYFWACNLNGNNNKEEVLHFLNAHLSSTVENEIFVPIFLDRTDLPDFSGWQQLINKALTAISNDELQKVVLARQTTFHATETIDPVSLIAKMRLSAKNLHLFCFEPASGRAFLGASPERLYKRTGNQLESEALAGTRPRSNNAVEDNLLEKELLASAKDRLEHQIVLDEISTILRKYCSELHIPSRPGIIKLIGCQHLHTPLSGILKENISDTMLLKALHPTPAVGGFPKHKALEWLHREEPFERGIYAAPVGWIGVDESEFCVGIRSGLINNDTLTLYSGAGIVKKSDAAEEWRELNAKLAFFLNIIGRDS